jgi:selenocysteine lyase/cysteine desulfurase
MIARPAGATARPAGGGGTVGDDTARWKHLFADFGGTAYLDCAGQGPFPRDSAEAARRAVRCKEHPEELPEAQYAELPARVREAAGRMIGCAPNSIAIGTGASHGLNLAARGLPLQEGDEILLAHGEFPANVYPWLSLEPRGIKVRFVRPAQGVSVDAATLVGAIGPRTRLIAVSLVSYSTGDRVELQAIGDVCRQRGLFLVVDGAQAIGAIDFRVADFPIDVLAVSGYKWLLGPYGTGFTYVNPRVNDRLGAGDVNWLTIKGAGQFNRLNDYRLEFREGARRFDVPETAAFIQLSAFATSLEILNRVRVPTVEAHVRRLLDQLLHDLVRTPLRAVSDTRPARRSTILALEAGSLEETHRIFRRLLERGVKVSLRENRIRVAPHIYNTPQDIERLVEAAATA